MEFIGFVILGVLAYLIYLGVKFMNFKSRLMSEFGRRGVLFDVADNIYFQAKDEINSLHHDGMPIEQIVERFMPGNESGATPPSGGEPQQSSELRAKPCEEDTPSEQERSGQTTQDKSVATVEFVAKILSIQQALMSNEEGRLPAKAFDNWSIGYVAGTADAVLQQSGFGPDAEGMAIMALIFQEVYGKVDGHSIFADFLRLQGNGDQQVEQGMTSGGTEFYAWMSNRQKVPTGWANYIHAVGTG